MRTIYDALALLDRSLQNLEDAALQQQRRVKEREARQQDLFAAAQQAQNGNGQHAYAIDPAILAGKLDVTIERVEQILREG